MKLLDQIMLLPDDEKLKLAIKIIENVQQNGNYVVPADTLRLVEEKLEDYLNNPNSKRSFDEANEESELSSLSAEQLTDLMQRNEDFERNPEEGIGWEELKEKIINGKWRAE